MVALANESFRNVIRTKRDGFLVLSAVSAERQGSRKIELLKKLFKEAFSIAECRWQL